MRLPPFLRNAILTYHVDPDILIAVAHEACRLQREADYELFRLDINVTTEDYPLVVPEPPK